MRRACLPPCCSWVPTLPGCTRLNAQAGGGWGWPEAARELSPQAGGAVAAGQARVELPLQLAQHALLALPCRAVEG